MENLEDALVMEVLHINARDFGGAGLAMLRLHQGLLAEGVSSNVWVEKKRSNNPEVTAYPPANSWLQKADKLARHAGNLTSLQYLFFPSTLTLSKQPAFQQANILHLHNIHGNFFAYPLLKTLAKGKPVVWTLHDMWAFTGHCSYSFSCERWKTGCGHCPDLSIYPALKRDTTAFLWKQKQKIFSRLNLHLVTPSHWLAKEVEASPILGHHPVHVIPNGVDTECFQLLPKKQIREKLGLPVGKTYLLFVAERMDEPRKGMEVLLHTLHLLARTSTLSLEIIILGHINDAMLDKIPLPARTPGYIPTPEIVAEYYAASDVYVLPTLQDNFPNTILESLACGTPCVVFESGGAPEAITHLCTGYLAQPDSPEDLAAGIINCLEMPTEETARRCRTEVETKFTLTIQAKRYLSLYHQVLSTDAN